MGKRFWSILQYIAFPALGLFLVWYQFHSMTAEARQQFQQSFQAANYWLLIPVIACSIASHISRAARWKLLIAPMGYRPSLYNAFATTMTGYLANSFLPRVGEVLKCTLLSKYERIPVDKLFGTILIERIFDLVCYLIFIVITILIQLDVVGGFMQQFLQQMAARQQSSWWLWALIALGMVLIVILLIRWMFRRFAHHRIAQKISRVFLGIREGVQSIWRLEKKGQFMAHTLFIWAMYLLQILIGFRAMEATAHLGIGAACSILTLATLAMILTPGGIGAFPVAIQQVLLLYAVNNGSFGWLMWGASTIIIIIMGLLSFVSLPYMNKLQYHATSASHPK